MGESGNELEEGLNGGSSISAAWFQPKQAKAYSGLFRFEPEMTVTASANGLGAEAESWDKSLPCKGGTLAGASTLLAGAVIAFGAVSLF